MNLVACQKKMSTTSAAQESTPLQKSLSATDYHVAQSEEVFLHY